MKTRVWIKGINFSDCKDIIFEQDDITIFVGPNNAGKSAALKDISNLSRNIKIEGKVAKKITIDKEGNEEDFITDLKQISRTVMSNNPLPTYSGFGFSVYESTAKSNWNNAIKNGLSDLSPVFTYLLNTEARLSTANPAPNIALTRDSLSHPIHFLQVNDEIEKQFSSYFRQSFNLDLIVHRNAGNQVPLHIGEKPIPDSGEDRVSINYLKKLEALPLLHEQGDGMRSFVGVLLNSFISSHSVLLVDEPEAFLHPPQARLLGKMLAKDLPRGKQLFLATHSGDFLRGLLDANSQKLKIIRIQRNGDINNVSLLNQEDIDALWNDPLLRYSNVLEGLFHSKVIITESDADCRFYSAILDTITDGNSEISNDILFIHCGGKHRMPSVIKALRKLNVPVYVITDFDVLNDLNPFKYIIDELGGDWSEVDSDWNLVKREIESKKPELSSEDVKKEIYNILERITDINFPKQSGQEIQKILKKSSAWSYAKLVGKSFVPSGDATRAIERIFKNLRRWRFFVVEVGELESLARSIGNHGPKWVNEVLQKDLKNDPELEIARKFVRQIIS
ncbi:MAG: AAA family ATPase [Eubacteriales bacterium]